MAKVANSIVSHSHISSMASIIAGLQQEHVGIPIVMELCAGSAGLSAALKAANIQVIPIDHNKNRHRTKVTVVNIDIVTPSGQQLVKQLLATGLIQHVHGAPPCGTASRARERPIPEYLRRRGVPKSEPLRDDKYPLGLPHLSGINLARVQSANAIYLFMASLPDLFPAITFSFENPKRSIMWQIQQWQTLAAKPGWRWVTYQNCAYGSKRDKHTSWLTNAPELDALAKLCDKKHEHEPYRIHVSNQRNSRRVDFDTAKEAEYTAPLCKEATRLLCESFRNRGLHVPEPTFDSNDQLPKLKRQRLASANGLFPRGRGLPQVIPEYKQVITLPIPAEITVKPGKFTTAPFPGAPAHGTVLRIETGQQQEELQEDRALHPNTAVIGVYHNPREFLEKAKQLQHPVDSTLNIHDSILRNIHEFLNRGAAFVMDKRAKQLKKWIQQAKDMQPAEDKLHDSMPESLRTIYAKKRFLLTECILRELNYPDHKIASEAASGFEIVGQGPGSAAFPSQLIPATITTQQLDAHGRFSQLTVPGSVRSSGDPEVDCDVWENTLKEAKRGVLIGPFSAAAEVSTHLGTTDWVANRRFGLRQGTKIRRIDDLSEQHVNAAYTTTVKLDLMGVEEVVSILKLLPSCISEENSIQLTLSDGSHLMGKLHDSLSREQALDWVGKTVDLADAYKQLTWREGQRRYAVLCVWNPHQNEVAYFISVSANFGAISSVYCFNRFSRAIWFIGASALSLVWTCYYDDFPTLAPTQLADNAGTTIKVLMELLGWQVDWGSRKDLPFSKTFQPLGVCVDMSSLDRKLIIISNKASRAEALAKVIDETLARCSIHTETASELAGKFQYAEGQIFGRTGKPAISMLHDAAATKRSVMIDLRLRRALLWLKDRILTAPPRLLQTDGDPRPILVFSDGAAEDTGTTCGAFVHDTIDGSEKYFGMHISDDVVKLWKQGGRTQVIGQAELYPITLTRMLFRKQMRNRRVFFFIDNDSARDAMVAAFSHIPCSMHIVYEFLLVEIAEPAHCWFARVPTASNPGDDPSRLKFSNVESDWPGAVRISHLEDELSLNKALCRSFHEDLEFLRK